jgi:uncharacterized protein YlxW (UPF0749 family)
VRPTTTDPRPEEDGVLERFVAQLIVDDYADAPVGVHRGLGAPVRWLAVGVAVLIGLLVTTALVQARTSVDQRQQTRTALVERVAALSAEVASRQAAVDEKAAAVDTLRATVLGDDSGAGVARADAIAGLATDAGTTALSGPGLIVTVDDAPDAEAGSLNRVLDRDLQDIVNALWQAGATGIAVNTQRLTGDTAIRSAGEAILVNYQPLTRPYTVSAVGTATSGAGESGLKRLLAGLSGDYGLVTDLRTGDVALPAGELRIPRFASTTPTTTDEDAGTAQ